MSLDWNSTFVSFFYDDLSIFDRWFWLPDVHLLITLCTNISANRASVVLQMNSKLFGLMEMRVWTVIV